MNTETEFVDFKMGAVETYLEQMDKSLDCDASNLYKEKFLKYIRVATENNIFYVKSECRAQMKKSVTYNVDVSIDCDGSIFESQCECAAGMGPNAHCKHVCCVLIALYYFSSNGEIVTEETCTQRLQTFHKSKRFKGSPIKACDLSVSAVRASNVNFDPRPRASQNTSNYQDYFRNICLNHKYGSTLPTVQLYPPANIYGVVTDHDYFEFHPEDKWLLENCISTITDEEISKIESFTSGQAKKPRWKEERCKRLQSSSFGRICKATERTDFEKLARSMTEIVDLKTAPILHGQKYEKSALSKYEQDFGRSPVNCGIYVRKSHPFIAASPDGIINDTVVEVKCPFVAKDKMISPKTIPFLLYNDGKLMLNESHNYYYQVQGQMFCTNLKNCHFVVFTLQEVQYIHIKRDDIFIQNMVEKLEDFYKTYFRKAILQKFLYKDYDKYSFE
ncbi:unnamed protein product [Mytilus coruscus]|uniref:SWIM-type domain-containing protein n=1 Tax=Mytilus coruscus TaxID=42192 RepID=A0A6J8BNS3_MYTCO|nr:unnamed protein product [Mytilus coruscus]